AHRSLRIWEVSSGRERRSPVTLDSGAWSVAFAPGGRVLATGGANGALRLWDAWSGKELVVRNPRDGPITVLAFGPAGRLLVSAGAALPVPTPTGPDTLMRSNAIALVWDVAALVKDLPAIPKPTAADTESLWAALKGDDPAKAHDALWRLTAAPE